MSYSMVYFRFVLRRPSVHVGGAAVGIIVINKEEPSAHMVAVGTHPDVPTSLQVL